MMAATTMFGRAWKVQINEIVNEIVNPLRNTDPILRVPRPLLETKPEAYVPQFMSFGPYHHSRLEKDIDSLSTEPKTSMAEMYKGKSVARLMQDMRYWGESFMSIVETIERMRPEIESFYRWPYSTEGGYSHNFALMMAADSSFLLQFLILRCCDGRSPGMDHEMINFCSIYSSCIVFDIRKLENQIPLSLLKVVFDNGKNALLFGTTSPFNQQYDTTSPFHQLFGTTAEFNQEIDPTPQFQQDQFNQLLLKICKHFSRFLVPPKPLADNERSRLMQGMDSEKHLMGCVHKYLSLVLKMQPGGGEDQSRMGTLKRRWRRLQETLLETFNGIVKHLKWTNPETEYPFSNGMSAGELARAGIKFRPFSKVPDCIRLDKDTATVYLPPISVDDIGTEVFLKNMLALEFNDASRPNYVTEYVALMGTLIQSPDDVRILVDRDVISRGYFRLTDEGMVKMWSDVRQPFLRGSDIPLNLELMETLGQWLVNNYRINKMKNYLSSWKFLAAMAAILYRLYVVYTNVAANGSNSKR